MFFSKKCLSVLKILPICVVSIGILSIIAGCEDDRTATPFGNVKQKPPADLQKNVKKASLDILLPKELTPTR